MEAIGTQSTQNVEQSEDGSNHEGANIRKKTDVAWKYVSDAIKDGNKRILICCFCQKRISGGGINRMKQHLANVKGHVESCKSVPPEVKFLMECALKENIQKAKEKKGSIDIEDEIEQIPSLPFTFSNSSKDSSSAGSKGKRKFGEISSFFKAGKLDSTQPSIKASMQSKERWHDTDKAIALWFYDACIPFNAVNSPFFQAAAEKIAQIGNGYKVPTYHALRVTLLKDAKAQVKLIVDSFRQHWVDFGCTIMGDGWTDTRQRPLINFLVYCSRGISFIKSVDASDIITNAEKLCNLFGDIVELVGPDNVVHMVTDNGANYKAAGRLLSERYPSIRWSPCATHCLNLIVKDIAEMPNVKDVATLASKITVFVYNHKWTLNWLRKRAGWTEIVRPGAIRFATTFIALKSLHDHKSHLQALVICDEFKKFLKIPKGREVKQIILEEKFWNNSLILVRVMTPIIRLLRICDSDEKPALGYVYEGMHRARRGIKELFKGKKQLYKPYTTIIKNCWDKMLRKSLHATAYWLNPAFQYDKKNFCQKPEVIGAFLDVISNQKLYSKQKLIQENVIFQDRKKGFSRPIALESANSLKPDEWWRTFGSDVPNLQKMAIRILSQTAASSGCERNWNVFERIHTKKRNRLEHQRLNDLVYIHYNLRLQNRSKFNKDSFDPVDYESIDKTEFWIVEEEQEGELDIDELESIMEEYPRVNEEPISIAIQENEEDELELPDGGDNVAVDDGARGMNNSDDENWMNYGRNE